MLTISKKPSLHERLFDPSQVGDGLPADVLLRTAMTNKKPQPPAVRSTSVNAGAPVPLTTAELFASNPITRDYSETMAEFVECQGGDQSRDGRDSCSPRPQSPSSPLALSGRSSHATSPPSRRRSVSQMGNVLSARSGQTSPNHTPRRSLHTLKPLPVQAMMKARARRSPSPPTAPIANPGGGFAPKPRTNSPSSRVRPGTLMGVPIASKAATMGSRSWSPSDIRRRSASPGLSKAVAKGNAIPAVSKARARPPMPETSASDTSGGGGVPRTKKLGLGSPGSPGKRAAALPVKRVGAAACHLGTVPPKAHAERDNMCDTAQLLCTAEDVLETRCVFDSDTSHSASYASIYDAAPLPTTVVVPEISRSGMAFSHNPISPMSSSRERSDSPHGSDTSTFTLDDEDGSPYLSRMKAHQVELIFNALRPEVKPSTAGRAASYSPVPATATPVSLTPNGSMHRTRVANGRSMDRCLLPCDV